MIRFEGDLSKENRRFLLYEELKITSIVAIISFLLISSLIFLLSIFLHIWILLFIVPVILICLATIFSPYFGIDAPKNVMVIDGFIYLETDKINKSRKISEIKKIIEGDNFYYLIFYFPHKCASYLCQKDLLVQGSLEEFEKLFEGKIVRKN